MEISWSVIFASVIISTFFFVVILGLGIKAQRRKPATGIEGFTGETGDVLETLEPEGVVRVFGEIWNAESLSGTIQKGNRIRVVRIKGLKLFVEPFIISKE